MNDLFSIFLSLCLFSAPLAHAQGGEHSGGGGNRVLQFKKIAYELVELLDGARNLPIELKRIHLKKLKAAIDQTTVEATDQTLRPSPNGQLQPAVIVDAINTPSRKLIRFNKDDWDFFPSGSKRTALVLHEYLGILHAQKVPFSDDTRFQISHFISEDAALRLWFDNSETAQALNGIEFDFPIACTYQYKDQAPEKIGLIGRFLSIDHVETYVGMVGTKISTDQTSGESLSVLIYNESDDFVANILGRTTSSHPSLRLLVGWTRNDFFFNSSPAFNQRIRLSTNFQFETELESLQLKIECHRVRFNGIQKPKDWQE